MDNEQKYDDEIEIDLLELFFALKQKLHFIIIAFLLGGILTFGYSKIVLTPKYTSTSMVYILSKETTLTSLADLQIGSQLTKDYTVMATSRNVLEKVIENLGIQDMDYKVLKKKLVLDNPKDTRILTFSIEDPDPVRAKAIVDEVAEVSSKYIGDIMEMIPPKNIETGEVSTQKSSPHCSKNALIGAFLAAFAVCGVICVKVILDDAIVTEDDVEKYLGLSVLASVPIKKGETVEKKSKYSFGKLGRKEKK